MYIVLLQFNFKKVLILYMQCIYNWYKGISEQNGKDLHDTRTKWLEDKLEKDEWVLDHMTKGLSGLCIIGQKDQVGGHSDKGPNRRGQTS